MILKKKLNSKYQRNYQLETLLGCYGVLQVCEKAALISGKRWSSLFSRTQLFMTLLRLINVCFRFILRRKDLSNSGNGLEDLILAHLGEGIHLITLRKYYF